MSRKKNPSARPGDTSPSGAQIRKADPSTSVIRSPGPPSETLACEVHGSAIAPQASSEKRGRRAAPLSPVQTPAMGPQTAAATASLSGLSGPWGESLHVEGAGARVISSRTSMMPVRPRWVRAKLGLGIFHCE